MFETSIYYKPNFRFSPHIVNPCLQPLKHISFHHFPTSESVSLCGFVLKKVVIEENRIFGTKIMTELVRASAFRSSSGCEEEEEEEGLQFLKNEATLSSSSSWASGIEWTLNSLSKWLVATVFGFAVLWKHDAEIIWAAIGAVLNACLSVALKGVLNQKRPIPTLRPDPGMPSSHAQSIFFAVSFAILSNKYHQRSKETKTPTPQTPLELMSISSKEGRNRKIKDFRSNFHPITPCHFLRLFLFGFVALFCTFIMAAVTSIGFNKVTATVGVLALAFSSYLSWLRVSQRLHTISQVVVGAILGSICSILWFQAWHAFVLKAFISFLWVRIVVVVGGATSCVSFLLYVFKHWVMAEPGFIKIEPDM